MYSYNVYSYTVFSLIWLTEEFTGHWLGWTHSLVSVSISWPGGHTQPSSVQDRGQDTTGLSHVPWQLEQDPTVCPLIGQDAKIKDV